MGAWLYATGHILNKRDGGDSIRENNIRTNEKKKGIIETTIYCMNTKRKYIYELSGGNIVSERIVEGAD